MPVVRKDLTKAQADELIANIRMEDPQAELELVPQTDGLFTVNVKSAAPAGGPPATTPATPAVTAPNASGAAPLVQSREAAIDTLARTLWGEARGESRLGKEAVAAVVLNRLKRNAPGRFGATIEEVCRKPLQFSCWNPNDPNRAQLERVDKSDAAFAECWAVAELAVDGRLTDPTDGADHYHTVNVSPSWSLGRTPCRTIDRHHFFNNIP
jgi:N-acetylmuramoyl-L-alanine amidase